MKINCNTIGEMLGILLNVEKNYGGIADPADKLTLELNYQARRLEIDYSDAKHRVIRAYGLDKSNPSLVTPKEWRDGDISTDEIASETLSAWAGQKPICALDYVSRNFFFRWICISIKQAERPYVKIDTSGKGLETNFAPPADRFLYAEITLSYKDMDDRIKLIETIEKWVKKNHLENHYIITEE